MPRVPNTLMATVWIVGIVIGATQLPSADAKPARGQPAAAASTAGATQRIVSLTNRERARHGLSALKVDGRCVSAISGHVADMARNGFLSHQGSDGRDPYQRYRKYSPSSRGGGENVAYNTSGTAEAFMRQWLNSSIHRSNILNPRFKGIGVAVRTSCSGHGSAHRCKVYAGQCFSL
ncbi:MAG: CAP domain-containing protein [Hyphomicrobiaceae bacterium]